jgi:nucleotide-binding universal stress UspA family protein
MAHTPHIREATMYYKHILLPVDGSDTSRKAEKECIAFAKSGGAKVTALHVVSHFHLHLPQRATLKSLQVRIEREHEEEARAIAQKMVDALAARAREKGVDCEGVVVVGDQPYQEIISSAESRKCDLIMMASHGRRGLDAVLLGSETVKVLTHTQIPVLVVR